MINLLVAEKGGEWIAYQVISDTQSSQLSSIYSHIGSLIKIQKADNILLTNIDSFRDAFPDAYKKLFAGK